MRRASVDRILLLASSSFAEDPGKAQDPDTKTESEGGDDQCLHHGCASTSRRLGSKPQSTSSSRVEVRKGAAWHARPPFPLRNTSFDMTCRPSDPTTSCTDETNRRRSIAANRKGLSSPLT